MDKEIFFKEVRASFFNAKKGMSQAQVEGFDKLIDTWEQHYSDFPVEFLAYCLATTWHETARTMQPIREYGRGRGRRYGERDPKTGHAYYGRGYVQLTWKYNYKKAGEKLGCDFVGNPDEVMRPDWAARILFTGCIDGWFTGKGLNSYISPNKSDYRSARRTVNGMDKASQIANYAKKFERALDAAQTGQSPITEKQLDAAGSRTIKAAKGNKDAGGAVIGIGVAGGAAEALKHLKSVTENLGDWRSVIDALIDSFVWLSSYWWAGLLAAGGLVLWNNRQIIKARLDDEIKIGRLSHEPSD